MRIGIYDPYLDDVGGGEKYMLTIAEILASDNAVSVFWNNREDFEKVKNRFSLDLDNVTLARNIFTPAVSKLKRLRESKKYDAIILLSDGSIPVLRTKLYIHIQRPLEHVRPSVITKLKIKRVRAFFCNSEYTKAYIDRSLGVHARVIYPPVSFSSQEEKKQNIILHVGRFRVFDRTVYPPQDLKIERRAVGAGDFKKQHIMIKVFKEMVDNGLKNWKFIMAVSVNDYDKELFLEMKKMAEGYPIEFEVNRSNESLWELYGKARIYWHASGYGEDLKKNPEYAEHFGISTVEAMGMGAVPVVIDAGGQKEIVTDGENGFTWSSLEEFKEKTLILLDSPKLWKKMSQNARIRAMDFTKSAFTKRIKTMLS